MNCPNCGNEVNENSAFCTRCGASLKNVGEPNSANVGMVNNVAANNGMPNNGMPNNGMPNNGMPNNGMPNNGMPNNGMSNNGMPNNGAPYTPYSPPQSSNYLPLIFITIGVTAVVTLGALFCISKISGNKKNHTLKDDSVNIVKNYDVLTEASTEEITEEETEPPTEAPAPTEPSNYTEYINRLVDGAYSIGWLNATNSHDASCMLPYTSPEYPVYQMLGTDYWQERPSVRFDYIQNVKVYGINKKYDGCYIVYVSYDYELYNSSTGQYSSNTELTVDTVVWDGSEYKLSEHNWKNDLPLGSTVTMSSFG